MRGFVMDGPTSQQFEEAHEAENFDLLAELARCHAISQIKKSTAIRFRYKGGGEVFRARYESGKIVLEVPHWAAGFVIGKRGRSARILQDLCDCPVEIRPYDDFPRIAKIKKASQEREKERKAKLHQTKTAFLRSKLREELGPEVDQLTDEEVWNLATA